MANQEDNLFKNVISHAKEYGFIFPSSEIYDGLSAVYDYGQNGAELKNNIKEYWWKFMTLLHDNIVGIDAAIFMHPTTWKASGHVDAFNDPMIDNKDSKKRYRADQLIEGYIEKIEEKINKEVEKAAKRFENFDKAMFVSTNPRVLEYQKKIDEVNDRLKNAMGNGDVAPKGIEQPVYYWAPSMGPSQVAFYKGNLFPEWKNSVFVAMLRGNSLERLTLSGGKVVNEEPLLTDVKMRIRDVRVGPDGAVYVLTDSGLSSITDNTQPTSKLLKLTPR